MKRDPFEEAKFLWYQRCTEESCKHPTGSFLETFWWSLRDELSKDSVIEQWADDPKQAIEDWHTYFVYKWEQGGRHRKESEKVEKIRAARKAKLERRKARDLSGRRKRNDA